MYIKRVFLIELMYKGKARDYPRRVSKVNNKFVFFAFASMLLELFDGKAFNKFNAVFTVAHLFAY